MKNFTPINTPIHADFYTIHDYLGKKVIHINGYTYESSSSEFESENNPGGVYWANLEVCHFVYDLDEFVKNYREKGYEWVDENYCDLNQYQGDFTKDEMVNLINTYFDGHGADAYLDFSEVTEDTPCGNYINLY